MLQSFARIFIVLFSVCVHAQEEHQPKIFIKEAKLVGSLHENNEVEAFIGLPFAKPPVGDLRWEKPIAWIPKTNELITANKFKPGCMQNQRIVNWYKRLILWW